MTDVKKELLSTVGRGVAVLSAGTWIIKLVTIATLFLILSKLNVYEYGLLEVAISIGALCNIFLLPGISSAIVADVGVLRSNGKFNEAGKILISYLRLMLVLGFLAWFLLSFLALLGPEAFRRGVASNLLMIVALTYLLAPFRTFFQTLFTIELKFTAQSLFTLIEEVIKLLALIVLFYFSLNSISVVLWAGIFSQIFVLIAFSFFTLKTFKIYRAAVSNESVNMFCCIKGHSLWSVVVNYINGLAATVRVFVITWILGVSYVGIYSVASGMLSHASSLLPLAAVLTPIMPKFFSDKDKFNRLVNKAIKYQLLAYALVIGGCIIGAPLFIHYLFPRYSSSLPIFMGLLISLIPSGFAAVFAPIYNILQAQKSLAYAIIIKTFSTIIFAPLFIYIFGLPGVIIEFVLTVSIFAIERHRRLRVLLPEFKLGLRSIVRFDELDKFIINTFVDGFKKTFKSFRI